MFQNNSFPRSLMFVVLAGFLAGVFTSAVSAQPIVNDDCADAIELDPNGFAEGSTIGATGVDITARGYHDDFDAWHWFAPETYGVFEIERQADFQATVSVFESCDSAELAFCDAWDDGLYFVADPNMDYLVRVAGRNYATGNYTLTVRYFGPPPQNDLCADALELSAETAFTGSTTGATGRDLSSSGDEDVYDVWHRFAPAEDGIFEISRQGNFPITLAVFDACGGSEQTSCGPCSSVLYFYGQSGQSYLIRVSGSGFEMGTYTLSVSHFGMPPENDLCGDAVEIEADLIYNGGTGGATGSDITNDGCDDIFDVWYQFTAGQDGNYYISHDNDDGFYDILSVFDSCGGLELAFCPASQPQLSLDATSGTTYLLRIAGNRGTIGDYSFALTGGLTIIHHELIAEVIGESGTVQPTYGTYAHGQVAELTATPSQGYKVKVWSGTDDDSLVDLINTVTINDDVYVTVEFEEKAIYTLAANVVDGNGTVEPNSGAYEEEMVVELTAIPDDYYSVLAWHGTDDDTSTETTNTVLMDADKVVTVQFERASMNLTTTVADGGGSISPADGPVPAGATIELAATPLPYHRVKSWSGTDDDSSTDTTNSVFIDADKSVTVTFEPIKVNLETQVIGGHGQIAPADGVYDAGITIALTASPDTNYRVKAWHGTDNDASTAATNSVLLDGDKNITVEFEPVPTVLTLEVIGGHAAFAQTSGTYNLGSVVELVPTLEQGYRIKAWHGTDDDSSRTNTNTVTLDAPKTVTVETASIISSQKVTVKASSSPGRDSITITGQLHAALDEIATAEAIHVKIWSADQHLAYNESIAFDATDIRKGKYRYKTRIKKGEPGGITSLAFDLNKHKFSLTIAGIALTGLSCPLFVDIDLGTYSGLAEAGEDIVNGKNPIPLKLMQSYADVLRLTKPAKLKAGKKTHSDSLVVQGEIAMEDTQIGLATQEVVVQWGNQLFSIPAGSLASKKGRKYTCKKVAMPQGGIVTATIDMDKNTFKIDITNSDIEAQSGTVIFGLEFGSFEHQLQLILP